MRSCHGLEVARRSLKGAPPEEQKSLAGEEGKGNEEDWDEDHRQRLRGGIPPLLACGKVIFDIVRSDWRTALFAVLPALDHAALLVQIIAIHTVPQWGSRGKKKGLYGNAIIMERPSGKILTLTYLLSWIFQQSPSLRYWGFSL